MHENYNQLFQREMHGIYTLSLSPFWTITSQPPENPAQDHRLYLGNQVFSAIPLPAVFLVIFAFEEKYDHGALRTVRLYTYIWSLAGLYGFTKVANLTSGLLVSR
ncbi:778f2347-d0fd-4bb5-83b5-99eb3f8e23e7 [Sclerotinia trifoliorum]|uniref:778f2347-d0fd-4bb5-83b5-99eb3f8e23e7 n=1 Tax=Sclerotinia trifoliorum TaxID=28548 RepID=A0A8H2VYD9_9HELO|nr:778f2347-d0fd-4bb5-83b5-99eb3f8e23e7 [Sclerotinia trifoliorum]